MLFNLSSLFISWKGLFYGSNLLYGITNVLRNIMLEGFKWSIGVVGVRGGLGFVGIRGMLGIVRDGVGWYEYVTKFSTIST